MTGSAEDGPEWQKHIGNKKQRRDLANQFKDAKNPFKIVIVRDIWLTGFDAPCGERRKIEVSGWLLDSSDHNWQCVWRESDCEKPASPYI